MVFARSINGQEHTFGVSGKLIMNAVVLYDHQTDTLWSQFLQEAVRGPLAGQRLDLLPSQLTTWAAWTTDHPDTLLLDRRVGLSGGFDPYSSYYQSNAAGILGEEHKDERLPRKELVVGLYEGPAPRAYPFSDLAENPVVNDAYDGAPIVVAFDPLGAASAVFSREVDGRTLTFEFAGDREMRDAETGSTWLITTGVAIEGELEGIRLHQEPSFASFWFAWTDFYPDTELFVPPPTSAG